MSKLNLFGIFDIRGSKDTLIVIASFLFWIFFINNVASFLNVVDTPFKLMLYFLFSIATAHILRKVIP